jgi:hypothetical protein
MNNNFILASLNHWIDLVFGYKQTGDAAVEAINVFHPATYYGFDLSSIEDTDLARNLKPVPLDDRDAKLMILFDSAERSASHHD